MEPVLNLVVCWSGKMICEPKTVSNLARHAPRYALVLVGVFLCAAHSFAQTSPFEGKTITDIQFTPLQPLHPDDLAAAMPLKKGAPLHASEIAAAIDGLFATGRFDDIIVKAAPDRPKCRRL